ncbi:4Fe-4S binding protein [Planifilum fimeticola]|uniref:4Fe-4S binding protein n=1 Tax=Planifilum fimeticola TaxID=201975 RepID=A0A2T0LA68_9BACL|nr:4Fe-4S binding protein [Planifilum fimeticola]PRX38643.1 4Fe-4S binding protein [Planifilum fimeticola]
MSLDDLFSPVGHEDEDTTYRVPKKKLWPPKAITRTLSQPATLLLADGSEVEAACLKCHPAPCIEYLPHESKVDEKGVPNNKPTQVCPTNTIRYGDNNSPKIDMDICVHCQLCIIRCPVGALYWNDQNEIEYDSATPSWTKELNGTRMEAKAATVEWQETLSKTPTVWSVDPDQIVHEIALFQKKIIDPNIVSPAGLKQEHYYPLVRNFFRALGTKAAIGKTGDTQWRFDGIVLNPWVMPIEIKAPSEIRRIEPGAARQAVENAALIESRFQLAVNPPSIVVGYELPNERSAVQNSCVHVQEAFGVSVGLYTTGVLLYLILRGLEYNFHLNEDLENLFRSTLGSCDESDLKAFWAEYMKKRLEIVVLGKSAEKAGQLAQFFPQGKLPAQFTVDELVERWKGEITLLDQLSTTLFPSK